MARRPTRPPLSVYLNGRLVGRLRRERTGAVDFQYDQTWLDWESAIPVSLSLPLREDRYLGDPVFAVFDNLLPDNDDIRRRLAERTGAAGNDAYSLLSAIGRDCVGALQFLPEGTEPGPTGTVDGRRVDDEEIGTIIANLARQPLGLGDDQDFRISIAGAQEKTALLFWRRRWHVPHGTTATTHILKPQMGMLPNGIDMTRSVENEHFCLKFVSALGLPAAKTEIIDFSGRRVLVVERFDRLWTRDRRLLRIPQEDLCQALSVPPSRKYQADGGPTIRDVSAFLQGSDDPDGDRRTFFKTQVAFWLLAAIDGHAKNFSIRLAPGGRFRLTPLYDIMSGQPALDANQITRNRFKLAMSVGDNRHYVVEQIQPRHFVQSADACGMPADAMHRIFEELLDTAPAAIETTLAHLPAEFPQGVVNSIVGGINARKRVLEAARD
jgi:serine/threonine-protein kinase HipA